MKVSAIGRILKTHGYKGHLKVHIEEAFQDVFEASTFLFVELDGHPVPLRIVDRRNDGIDIIRFEDINSREEAVRLHAKALFIEAHRMPAQLDAKSDLEFEDLIGFTLWNGPDQVGQIMRIVAYPQQEMAIVIAGGQEVLIPLNHHFIRKIDGDERRVDVDLPEGLLDLS